MSTTLLTSNINTVVQYICVVLAVVVVVISIGNMAP